MSDVAGRNVWLPNMAALGARGGSSGEPAQTADNQGMAVNENLQPLPAAASASPATIPAVDEPRKSPEPRGVGLSISPLILKQMEDEVVEEAQLLGREQYTENSPSGNVLQRAACNTAEVWKTVKRLKDVSLMGKILQNSSSIAPGFSNKDFQHSVMSSPSLTTSKMMSRWTGNRYIHVSMYS